MPSRARALRPRSGHRSSRWRAWRKRRPAALHCRGASLSWPGRGLLGGPEEDALARQGAVVSQPIPQPPAAGWAEAARRRVALPLLWRTLLLARLWDTGRPRGGRLGELGRSGLAADATASGSGLGRGGAPPGCGAAARSSAAYAVGCWEARRGRLGAPERRGLADDTSAPGGGLGAGGAQPRCAAVARTSGLRAYVEALHGTKGPAPRGTAHS